MPQVLRRLNEIQMNELPVGILPVSQTVLKKKHNGGPMINACNGKQYKMLVFQSWTIRTNSNSDGFVILNNQKVVRISNVVENEYGVFLIGQHFMRKSDSFHHPLASSRLGVYCAEQLSPLKRWPITAMKCKAICLPKSINNRRELYVYPLLMQRN